MGGLVGETEWPEIWECNTTAEVLEQMEKYGLDGGVVIPPTKEDRAYIIAYGYKIEASQRLLINYQESITSDDRVIYFAFATPKDIKKWRTDFREYRKAQEDDKAFEDAIKEIKKEEEAHADGGCTTSRTS